MDITFFIDGVEYSIPMSAYSNGAEWIELPSGDVYSIEGWLESYPPQPQLEYDAKLVKRTKNIVAAWRVK